MLATSPAKDISTSVKREFVLPRDQVDRLQRLADTRQISESHVVEKALDVFFSIAEVLDQDLERLAWHQLSESALRRVWDNDADAAYDNWRELYGLPEG